MPEYSSVAAVGKEQNHHGNFNKVKPLVRSSYGASLSIFSLGSRSRGSRKRHTIKCPASYNKLCPSMSMEKEKNHREEFDELGGRGTRSGIYRANGQVVICSFAVGLESRALVNVRTSRWMAILTP